MVRVLVTGGAGVLGTQLLPRLRESGYGVRILSRRPRMSTLPGEVEWVQAELETGVGLAEALNGAQVVIHAASSPFRRTRQVDVDGTRRLLELARRAGISHFYYISIAGIDRVPFPYYRYKLAAERLVEESGLPYSILRATQFHELLDEVFLRVLFRFPLVLLPADFKFQLIDSGEVASRMVQSLSGGPAGRLPDIGGPKVQTLGEIAQSWRRARNLKRRVIPVRIPGKLAEAWRRGLVTVPQNRYGRISWEEWLQEKYGANLPDVKAPGLLSNRTEGGGYD